MGTTDSVILPPSLAAASALPIATLEITPPQVVAVPNETLVAASSGFAMATSALNLSTARARAGNPVLTSVRGVRGLFDIETGEHFEPVQRRERPPKERGVKGIRTPGVPLEKGSDARVFTFGKTEVRVWSPEAAQNAELMLGLAELAKYPDIYPFVAVMPDFHLGESAINGTVIPSRNTLYVNAIGGDIGCGMTCVRMPVALDDIEGVLRKIYEDIYARVPCGRRTHAHPTDRVKAHPIFSNGPEFMNRSNTKSAMREFGTLGSGNHFVEIQANVHGEIFVMIHTGSRVLGQHIRADAIRRGERVQRPKGLVTLAADSAAGQDYLANVDYAVRYATENRMEILRQVIEAFRAFVPSMRGISADKIIAQAIDTPHNFIARENHGGEDVYVHRKGAIRVRHGDIGLIPGSMGTSSYIVRGKGNEASLWSSSHGAGRRLTRGQAMKTIKPERYEDTMVGIIARRDGSILDEAPDAYKDIDVIMGYQRDLVAIVEKLRPLAVVKG